MVQTEREAAPQSAKAFCEYRMQNIASNPVICDISPMIVTMINDSLQIDDVRYDTGTDSPELNVAHGPLIYPRPSDGASTRCAHGVPSTEYRGVLRAPRGAQRSTEHRTQLANSLPRREERCEQKHERRTRTRTQPRIPELMPLSVCCVSVCCLSFLL